METINHECYVSLEIASLLKEAGFDWKCYKVYKTDMTENLTLFTYANKDGYRNTSEFICSAPTLEVAQKWLREVKGVDINILVESISSHKQYLVSIWFNISDKSAYDNAVLDNRYNTYEEAQEAGIKKALELILETGE